LNPPTLSVIMPIYNKASELPKGLELILNQSFQPKEIIIVDDGSTDNSFEIIESFAQKYPIIQAYKNEKNRGVNFTQNRCLELVTGDYLHSGSAEDHIFPRFYEKSMKLLGQYPQAGLCTSLCLRVDDHGNKLSTVPEPPYLSSSPHFIPPEEMLNAITKKEFESMSATTLFRVDILKEIGGFPYLKHYEDIFISLLLGLNYGVCFIPEPLGQFLLSSESGSNMYRTNPEAIMDISNQTKQLMTSNKFIKYFPPLLIQDFMTRQRYLSGAIALTNISKAYEKSIEGLKIYAFQNLSISGRIFFSLTSFIAKALNLAMRFYLFLRLRNITWRIFLRACYRIRNKIEKQF